MIYFFLFIFGSIAGSFLNVLIYRMPREEKIGMTRSRCPHCKHTIRWYDNIPFFSYIFLGAKCRDCKKPISPRYFVVEFLTAFTLCLLWWRFEDPIFTAIYFIFAAFLIIGSFIDIEFLIIPDAITLGGLILGIIISAVYPSLMYEKIWWRGLAKSFLGAISGAGVLFAIAFLGEMAFKKEAMGMGDVKLLAMIGSFIGWKWALFTIFIGSLFGTIGGVALILMNKTTFKGKIPFGPYIALGAIFSLLFGKHIIDLYTKLFWI